MHNEYRITHELIRERQHQAAAESGQHLPEESYYVNKHMYSRLTPAEIPQPKGKIYQG